ncbi:uncharacterized protein LOC110683885 [Chenopodium quinoa]|uniref:uncharacterized protein LOC110683885 n=1 Tax=Chenopodium quinoa TaxID=63459 RepID=UPI000B7708A2|nr:uncharacterized protein LOC110683885 [Chenopodium quinoa]
MATIRCLLAVVAGNQWSLFQLDINNAFLHGSLDEEEGDDICIAVVYVDDIILTGSNQDILIDLKSHLHDTFSITDLGELSYFLGIEVSRLSTGIILSQRKFTRELLEICEMDVSRSTKTSLPISVKLSATEGDLYQDPEHYRSLVGKLNFLSHTRPDISFAVQTLSQFMQCPRLAHVKALQHLLRYVAGTIGQGLFLQAAKQVTLQAYSNSDWGACIDSRRSITGYLMMLGNSLISWKSKKQSIVSKSSTEAEYRAIAAAASEIVWLVRLFIDLGVTNLTPVNLNCDYQSAIHLAKNPVMHERTKHIEIDCHFTRDKVLEGLIELSYVPSDG